MTKREALQVLLVHTYVLSDTAKRQLLGLLPGLSDEQVNSIGRFLALEKANSLSRSEHLIATVNTLLTQLPS